MSMQRHQWHRVRDVDNARRARLADLQTGRPRPGSTLLALGVLSYLFVISYLAFAMLTPP